MEPEIKLEGETKPTEAIQEEKDVKVNSELLGKEENVEVSSELEQKIIKQVEFYYGDINLGRDKFLQEQVKLDDGWVPLETMLKFNRLKSLCNDETKVAAALKKSTSGLLEISEDGKKIRRSPSKPLPAFSKEQVDTMKCRSIYVKKFPLDSTLDQLMAFFEQFGRTELIVMRKDLKKAFKGSCFVVYETKESAEKFLKEPELKYNNEDLLREFKHEYYQRKADEKKAHQAERVKAKEDLKAKKDVEEQEDLMKQLVSGAVLNIENMPKSAKVDDVREFFGKYGDVKWVDVDDGEKDVVQVRVRFGDVDGAKTALEKAKEADGGKITFKNVEINCHVLDGDSEIEHWKNLIKSKKDRFRDRGFNNRKRGFGGRRDFPQRKRQRRQDDDGGHGSDDGNSD